jgi:hypothetical protein
LIVAASDFHLLAALQSQANIESGHGAVEVDKIAWARALDLADTLRFADSRCDEAKEQASQARRQLCLSKRKMMEHGVHIPIQTY